MLQCYTYGVLLIYVATLNITVLPSNNMNNIAFVMKNNNKATKIMKQNQHNCELNKL